MLDLYSRQVIGWSIKPTLTRKFAPDIASGDLAQTLQAAGGEPIVVTEVLGGSGIGGAVAELWQSKRLL